MWYICCMKTQKRSKKHIPDWENVKLPGLLVEELREHKKKTLIPIGKFVEAAVVEKLEKTK